MTRAYNVIDDNGKKRLSVEGKLLMEPERPFLGTVRLEALPYRNVDMSKFYPYGDVSVPERTTRPFQQRSWPC